MERQVVMGGRLGTNLIELGYMTEVELVEFLGKLFDVPIVQATDLDDIPPEVTQLISRDLAKKYNAIPFKRQRNSVSVALMDPLDLEAIQELQFITGCVIKSFMTSEVRILYGLEHYYQIDRQLRYVSVLDDEKKRIETLHEGKKEIKEPTKEDLDAALQIAKDDLVEARDRDDAIGTFLKAVNVSLDRGILFLVKAGTLAGWRAFPSSYDAKVVKLRLKIDDLPHFKEVLKNKSPYRGPAPPLPGYQELYDTLGNPPPRQILAVPVMINDNVVALLYGDHETGKLSTLSLEFILKISRKVSMALEILILRKKILDL